MRNVIVAFWGNNGVGKTTFSSAVAAATAREGKNGFNVLLVNADPFCPAFGQWTPKLTRTSSLGRLMTYVDVSTNEIMENVIFPGDKKSLGLIGYEKGARLETYDAIQESNAREFLNVARKIEDLDAIFVDCQNPYYNEFSAAALALADIVISLVFADAKGTMLYQSMSSKFEQIKEKTIIIPTAICSNDPVQRVTDEMGGSKWTIPYINEAHKKMINGNLFDGYSDPSYREVVKRISSKIQEAAGYVG